MERINDKDIEALQRQTRWVKPPVITAANYRTEEGYSTDLVSAQRWAKAIEENGGLSDGADLDGRLTAIKHNIISGDLKSAVLGLVGALEERVSKLSSGGILYNDDGLLIKFLVDFRIEKLSEESPIHQLFLKYKQLRRDY